MTKPKTAETYNLIQLEGLDSGCFKALIRELVYNYKEWQSIEAKTGSEKDTKFGIQAYEKADFGGSGNENNKDSNKIMQPAKGNLWVIQGCIENVINPQKIKTILKNINPENPPYGYILAASSDFSKESRDVFREGLKKLGVMEFYLWGKKELEDMLHMPKNDRILFTFFGYSLAIRRKSIIDEVRSIVDIKNELFSILTIKIKPSRGFGNFTVRNRKTNAVIKNESISNFSEKAISSERSVFSHPILIRDINDKKYPYTGEYADFKNNPRWKKYIAYELGPKGLWCRYTKYFAYVDLEKKEWDFTSRYNLLSFNEEDGQDKGMNTKNKELIEGTWKFIPRKNQAYLYKDALIDYSDIAAIDEKGDSLHKYPHLYTEFKYKDGPFSQFYYILEVNGKKMNLTDDYKLVDFFPKQFKKNDLGVVHREKIKLDPKSLIYIKGRQEYKTLYSADKRYDHLKPRDIITINTEEGDLLFQVTHNFKSKVKDYLKKSQSPHTEKNLIHQQLGRVVNNDEEISIVEIQNFNKL